MNDRERQVGCRVPVLFMDLCVEERRLLGGASVDELMYIVDAIKHTCRGKPLSITCASSLRIHVIAELLESLNRVKVIRLAYFLFYTFIPSTHVIAVEFPSLSPSHSACSNPLFFVAYLLTQHQSPPQKEPPLHQHLLHTSPPKK